MLIEWQGKELSMKLARYANGAVAVVLMDGTSRFATLSTNLTEVEREYEEFFVPLWNFSDPMLECVLAKGVVVDTGRRIFSTAWNEADGGPEAAIWRIVDPAWLDQLDAWIDEDMKAADAVHDVVVAAAQAADLARNDDGQTGANASLR